MMKKTIFMTAALLLSPWAAAKQDSPYTYNELLIVNNSEDLIRSVTVRAADTDRVTSCYNVPALGVCAKRFGRRRYTQAPFSVDWILGNNPRETSEFVIEVPAYNSPGVSLRVVFEFSSKGAISAHVDQSSRRNK